MKINIFVTETSGETRQGDPLSLLPLFKPSTSCAPLLLPGLSRHFTFVPGIWFPYLFRLTHWLVHFFKYFEFYGSKKRRTSGALARSDVSRVVIPLPVVIMTFGVYFPLMALPRSKQLWRNHLQKYTSSDQVAPEYIYVHKTLLNIRCPLAPLSTVTWPLYCSQSCAPPHPLY